MKLLEFIKEHSNWEELLSKPPYSLIIRKDEGYVLLKYNQLESDFSLDIVKEARGIILREKDLKVVCFPFTKFFNVGEEYASKIDWNSARVQEKIDGNLIKIWYDKNANGLNIWHISTNGMIDAFKCDTGNDLCPYKTFGELFMSVFPPTLFNHLNRNYTYMFELVSPWTKIIVNYPWTQIYHLGTRDNTTFQELNVDIGITKPQEYPLKTESEVKNAASELPYNEEGYVVVDKDWNRIKIKSPEYVNAHRLINNKVIDRKKILDLIRKNDYFEFLSYFPEYKKVFSKMETRYRQYRKRLYSVDRSVRKIKEKSKDRKDFARRILKSWADYYVMAFMIYDNKITDINDYITSLPTEKIIQGMEKYEHRVEENKAKIKRRKEVSEDG